MKTVHYLTLLILSFLITGCGDDSSGNNNPPSDTGGDQFETIGTTSYSDLYGFTTVKETLFFAVKDQNGIDQFATLNQSNQTPEIIGTLNGKTTATRGIKEITPFLDKVCFSYRDQTYGTELFCGDATEIDRVTDLNPDQGSSNPQNLIVCDKTLYFQGEQEIGHIKLFAYDGGKVSPVTLKSGMLEYMTETEFACVDKQLHFNYSNALYKIPSNGVEATKLADFPQNFADGLPKDEEWFSIEKKLYMITVQNNGTPSPLQIWKVDNGQFTELKSIENTTDYQPLVTLCGDTHFFRRRGDTAIELWGINQDGISLIKDGFKTTRGIDNLHCFQNKLYFRGTLKDQPETFFQSDGTANGTTKIDLPGGPVYHTSNETSYYTILDLNGTLTLYQYSSDQFKKVGTPSILTTEITLFQDKLYLAIDGALSRLKQ